MDKLLLEVPVSEEERVRFIEELGKPVEFFSKHHEFFKRELVAVMQEKMQADLIGSSEEAIREFKYNQGHANGRIELLTFLVDLSNPEYQSTIEVTSDETEV